MILIILKGIIYYLLIGSLFTFLICGELNDMIDIMKSFTEDDDEIFKIPHEKLRKYVIIVFTVLWPVFAYQMSKRNKL